MALLTPRQMHAGPIASAEPRLDNPAFQAFWLLRIGLTIAPIVARLATAFPAAGLRR